MIDLFFNFFSFVEIAKATIIVIDLGLYLMGLIKIAEATIVFVINLSHFFIGLIKIAEATIFFPFNLGRYLISLVKVAELIILSGRVCLNLLF